MADRVRLSVVTALVMLNVFLYPHGPITWLFGQLLNWWASVLGLQFQT